MNYIYYLKVVCDYRITKLFNEEVVARGEKDLRFKRSSHAHLRASWFVSNLRKYIPSHSFYKFLDVINTQI